MRSAISEPIPAHNLDLETVLDLSRRTDPIGVLSIYVDARPGEPRAMSIEIGNRVAELERAVTADGPKDRARAVRDAIGRLRPTIDRLTDPGGTGRGRALFATIANEWSMHIVSHLPVPNRVVLEPGPFVHPLLELLDNRGPYGVIVATRSEARLLEWRLGELILLRELGAPWVEPPHERSGPVGSRPTGRHSTPTGEQRNARDRDQAARFVERVGAVASMLGEERGWKLVLVSAGEQLTDPLIGALAPELREVALPDPRLLVGFDLPSIEQTVTDRVSAVNRESERRLMREIQDGALDSSVALGVSEVVAALNQARVAHLIYDPLVRYQGMISADGSLFAVGEMVANGPRFDPRMTERIVQRALETGARVTPVEGGAEGDLGEVNGIAAVLRW